MIAVVTALLLMGLVLLALEVFAIPGFGVVGLLGILALIGAVALAYWKLGALEAGAAFALGLLGAGGLFWYFPRSRAAKALVLEEAQRGIAADPALAALLGQIGTALTPLRPAGMAQLADRAVDVVTDGGYVEPGTRIQVKLVEGSRVVVEPVPDYRGG